MHESFTVAGAPANVIQGTKVPRRSPKTRKFGKVARVLWPHKTAAELAYRAHVTERAAKYWLAGKHGPSAAAIAAVVAEMLD